MTKSRNRQFADLADSASIIDGSTASYTTAEETKLAGIEASATADQTAAEVRALVESATDSNVFTDADHTKLNGIEASATADQTAAEIRTLVESATDSNVFTDADHTKLNGIEASATADQTDAEIKTAYENNSDTNAFTDALQTKLNGIATSANNYVHPNHSGEVTSTADGATVIADNVVDEANLKVSNSPTNGYFLSAQSGNTGGLTWAAVSSVGGATGVDFDDSVKARFGTGNDLEIYHDGSNSYIDDSGTGRLYLRGDDRVQIQKYTGEDMITAIADGGVKLYYDNSNKLETVTGGVTITGTCTASVFNATSDATLKTNIVPIENPLAILEKITGVSFDWRDNEGSAEGVLAQDVEQVLPNAVSTDEKGKKSVSYNNLVGVLIEAVKGQQEQINKLKDKLNGLSG